MIRKALQWLLLIACILTVWEVREAVIAARQVIDHVGRRVAASFDRIEAAIVGKPEAGDVP